MFWEKMLEETDKIFLFTFWNSFRSDNILLCSFRYNKKDRKEFKDLLVEISNSHQNDIIAIDLLYHFKIYLMQALANYTGDKGKMLFEAEQFYRLRLKNLILKVLNGKPYQQLHEQLEQMDKNFRFYYKCIEKEDIMYLLTKEFRMLKSAQNSNKKCARQLHTRNMAFLAGILKEDHSSISGLKLISDQTPEFIGSFLELNNNQEYYLNRRCALSIEELKADRRFLLKYLEKKIPVFEVQFVEYHLSSKFTLLKNFTNPYRDFLKNDELIDLARTLFRKIFLL
jgi:hypothetical protein